MPVDTARLRALIAAATPGPWWMQYEYDGARTVAQLRSTDRLVCINRACHADGNPAEKTKENAELIAEAVNALPGLLDELERLRFVVDALVSVGLVEQSKIEEAGKLWTNAHREQPDAKG